MSPEDMQRMVDMLPIATSLAEIGRALGVPQHIIRQRAQPYLTLLRLAGSLPDCECGQPRYHHALCRVQADISGLVTPEKLARRQLVIDMLVDGMPLFNIDAAFNRSKGWAKQFKRHLTPAQLAERERKLGSQPRGCPPSEAHGRAVKLLAQGLPYTEITAALGLPHGVISRCKKFLSPEQAAERRRIERERADQVLARRDRRTGRLLPANRIAA